MWGRNEAAVGGTALAGSSAGGWQGGAGEARCIPQVPHHHHHTQSSNPTPLHLRHNVVLHGQAEAPRHTLHCRHHHLTHISHPAPLGSSTCGTMSYCIARRRAFTLALNCSTNSGGPALGGATSRAPTTGAPPPSAPSSVSSQAWEAKDTSVATPAPSECPATNTYAHGRKGDMAKASGRQKAVRPNRQYDPTQLSTGANVHVAAPPHPPSITTHPFTAPAQLTCVAAGEGPTTSASSKASTPGHNCSNTVANPWCTGAPICGTSVVWLRHGCMSGNGRGVDHGDPQAGNPRCMESQPECRAVSCLSRLQKPAQRCQLHKASSAPLLVRKVELPLGPRHRAPDCHHQLLSLPVQQHRCKRQRDRGIARITGAGTGPGAVAGGSGGWFSDV